MDCDRPPVSSGLASAAALAYSCRPDDIEVDIDTDIKLNLKQRLSTAWEFISIVERGRVSDSRARHGDDPAHGHGHGDSDSDSDSDATMQANDTVRRLAAQAVRARLPARTHSKQVFSSRPSGAARMTPVAVIALVLISVVDLDVAKCAPSASSNEMVVSESVRLRDYGRRMQARARQHHLPQSDQQSLRLQELGNRMQIGALSRDAAVSRLRDLDDALDSARREAYNQGEQTKIGPLSTQAMTPGRKRPTSVHRMSCGKCSMAACSCPMPPHGCSATIHRH
jgi:hypothetical protein